MTDDRYKQIDEIIDEFDFHKVFIAMQVLDWKWVESGGPAGVSVSKSVPTIARMKASARDLLYRSINAKITGSGGFEARYHPSVDGDPEWFELRFILEEVVGPDFD